MQQERSGEQVPNRSVFNNTVSAANIGNIMMSVIVYVTVTARQHHASLQLCEKSALGNFKVSYGVLVLLVFEILQNVIFDEISGFVLLEIVCVYSDFHDVWDVYFVHSEQQGVSVSNNMQICSNDVIVQFLQVLLHAVCLLIVCETELMLAIFDANELL
jgi:hypothetical protein